MSNEAVTKFWDEAKSDSALQAQLKELESLENASEVVTRIVSVAEGAGYTFEAKDFEAEYDRRVGQLSDEDLESVAGGFLFADGSVRSILSGEGHDMARPEPNKIIAILIA